MCTNLYALGVVASTAAVAVVVIIAIAYCCCSFIHNFIFARVSKNPCYVCNPVKKKKQHIYHTYPSVSGRGTYDVDSFRSYIVVYLCMFVYMYSHMCVCI